jgi:hypothetical protein
MNLYIKRILSLSLVLLFGCEASHADEQCRSGHFSSYNTDFKLFEIAEDKAFFLKDYKGCPNTENCKRKYYSSKGDRMVVSKQYLNWSCAWNVDSKKLLAGWVETKKMSPIVLKSVLSQAEIEGVWKNGRTGKIKIVSSNEGALKAVGEAIWYGNSINHEGGFEGELVDTGSQYQVKSDEAEYQCLVNMFFISQNYMVAQDNGNCGGVNVRFNGVYKKLELK